MAAIGLCTGLAGIAVQLPRTPPVAAAANAALMIPPADVESPSFLEPGELLPDLPQSASVLHAGSAAHSLAAGDARVTVVDIWAEW